MLDWAQHDEDSITADEYLHISAPAASGSVAPLEPQSCDSNDRALNLSDLYVVIIVELRPYLRTDDQLRYPQRLGHMKTLGASVRTLAGVSPDR
jgi:hypothetical protein